jgi:hypothetical protein
MSWTDTKVALREHPRICRAPLPTSHPQLANLALRELVASRLPQHDVVGTCTAPAICLNSTCLSEERPTSWLVQTSRTHRSVSECVGCVLVLEAAMGCDGGTIPTRGELVKEKKRDVIMDPKLALDGKVCVCHPHSTS